jgi:hypothetical protein
MTAFSPKENNRPQPVVPNANEYQLQNVASSNAYQDQSRNHDSDDDEYLRNLRDDLEGYQRRDSSEFVGKFLNVRD